MMRHKSFFIFIFIFFKCFVLFVKKFLFLKKKKNKARRKKVLWINKIQNTLLSTSPVNFLHVHVLPYIYIEPWEIPLENIVLVPKANHHDS
jgi:hypothetical protein